MVIYFTSYVHSKSIKMISLGYLKLMGKVKQNEGKKKLMINDCVINKVLDKTKEVIDNEKFDSTKILIDTDNRLKDDINFKNVLILMTCVDNDNCDNDKYYPQLFLEEAL